MTEKGKKKYNIKRAMSDFSDSLTFSVAVSGVGYAGHRAKHATLGRLTNAFGKLLAYTSAKSYGLFFLTFGFFSIFSQLLKYYFESNPTVQLSSLVLCAVITLFSLPLLRVDKPLAIMLQDIKVIDFILFEFFSINRMHRGRKQASIPPIAAVIIGLVPSVCGFFLGPQNVFLAICVLIFAVIAFASPEFSLIFTILTIPFMSFIPDEEIVIAVLALLTFISFLRKVILGKRVYNFEIYDIFVIAISVFLLVSAFVNGESSMKINLVFALILLLYFTASNLLVNRRLADCAVSAIIVSAIPVSSLTIVKHFIKLSILPKASGGVLEYLSGISFAFNSSETLAAFLLVSIAFTVGYAADTKKTWAALAYIAVIILQVTALILTFSTWALAILAVSFVVYFIIKSKRIASDILLIAVILMHGILFLSADVLNSFIIFEGEAPAVLIAELGKAFELFRENLLIGVGFAEEVPKTNLFLGVGLKMGIFVLILFLLLLVARYRHISHYRRYVKNSAVDVVSNSSALALFALIMYGVFYSVIDDVSMYALFMLLFGISSASLRSAKNEYDDRMGYYSDSRSADASSLDIEISKKE